jgi:hypothetical protein
MVEFPKPFEKDTFPQLRRKQCEALLRQSLYDHIISNDENNYFDIDRFNKTHVRNEDLCEELFEIVIEELVQLGWKYKICFGGTGLFIYSGDTVPRSAW